MTSAWQTHNTIVEEEFPEQFKRIKPDLPTEYPTPEAMVFAGGQGR